MGSLGQAERCSAVLVADGSVLIDIESEETRLLAAARAVEATNRADGAGASRLGLAPSGLPHWRNRYPRVFTSSFPLDDVMVARRTRVAESCRPINGVTLAPAPGTP